MEEPTLIFEREEWAAGRRWVAGIDEVGRGPLAGPVMAAAVVLNPGVDLARIQGVRDSKLLTPQQREALAPLIRRDALAVGLGQAGPEEVDSVGIVEATRLAMLRALAGLPLTPHSLLIDALTLPTCLLPQRAIIHGDRLCLSIACASIVAKVARDRLMAEMEKCYPGYGFARHKGYPTPQHQQALASLGPCPLHRRSFRPVREAGQGHPTAWEPWPGWVGYLRES
ncbi:MAG TPA: ribonuclease HII [Dehalococcoidia bacterium]|nr:ribonuclease HII [Dehalococcoidia bacterium]HLB29763.1 ribonuclease HII [Dehalococcoidia bacterium]